VRVWPEVRLDKSSSLIAKASWEDEAAALFCGYSKHLLSALGMAMKTFMNAVLNAKRQGAALAMFTAMLFGLAGLAGCGGGGGGDSGGSTPTVPPPVAASGISLVAGAFGGEGNLDGSPGRLSFPRPLAFNSKGDLFVYDTNNCSIRKITGNKISAAFGNNTCAPPLTPDGFIDSNPPLRVNRMAWAAANDISGQVYFGFETGLGFAVVSSNSSNDSLGTDPNLFGGFRGLGSFGFNANGTLFAFATDEGRFAIYRFDPNGTRTLLAGGYRDPASSGDYTYADGVGAAAGLSVSGMAIAKDGNIYFTNQNAIRKVTPAGVVSTLAGDPTLSGSVDGIGAAARFNSPAAIAVDNDSNMYVADSRGSTIRKVTSAGVVTTLAGTSGVFGAADGAGGAAKFMSIYGIAVDKSGAVFVSDELNHAIRRVSPEGNVTTVAGVFPSPGNTDGRGNTARFSNPAHLGIDAMDNIYVTDLGNGKVRKISPAGEVTTFAANLTSPNPIDPPGSRTFRFQRLAGITLDKLGNVYITDTESTAIRKITTTGQVSSFRNYALGGGGNLRPQLSSMTIDGAGNFYVIATSRTERYVIKETAAGVESVLACGTGCEPTALAADSAGNVYVAAANSTIKRIAPDGTVVNLAGDAAVERLGSTDGVGTAARFNGPRALAVDNKGNVFVADTLNHTIRKITSTGVVTTIAGKAGVRGAGAGSSPGLLNFPQGIVVDSAGNLFVTTEDAVVKIVP
jgi:sugar lactone lactonase YvrE